MSKLEIINKFIFQWFFVRLTKHMKKDSKGEYTIIEKWSLHGFIIPCTGWNNNYKYVSKPKFFL